MNKIGVYKRVETVKVQGRVFTIDKGIVKIPMDIAERKNQSKVHSNVEYIFLDEETKKMELELKEQMENRDAIRASKQVGSQLVDALTEGLKSAESKRKGKKKEETETENK